MDISTWLDEFKKNWLNYNVDGILNLFDKDVEYWETPFVKISSLGDLEREWNGIKNQINIELNFELFNSESNKYSVVWNLKYLNQNHESKHYAGTYFITLNSSNKCIYFFQTFQSE